MRQPRLLPRGKVCARFSHCVTAVCAMSIPAWPAEPALTGTVTDSLGAVIPGATVVLMQNGKDLATATTDAAGKFQFKIEPGRALRGPRRGQNLRCLYQPGNVCRAGTWRRRQPHPLALRGGPEHCGHSHRPGDAGGADRNLHQRHRQHRPDTRIDVQGALRDEVGGQVVRRRVRWVA